jgi:hypothetical protein
MKITFHNVPGTIEVYMDCLRAICGDTAGKSMIDLCCAFAPNTPKLGFSERHYIDIIPRVLDHPEEQKSFHRHNALTIPLFMAEQVDVAICSDGIEHFYPDDGKELIAVMKQISRKQIIFTPLGEIFPLHNTTPDDPEAHHSLWTPEDFPGWLIIEFPEYHKEWKGGAFFAMNYDDIQAEYTRIWSELMISNWANQAHISFEP